MLLHRDVTPSPTLRAHELAILATPLVLGLGVQTVNRSNSSSPDSQAHTYRTLDNAQACGNGVHTDSASLHRLTMERRKLLYQRKRSRRYLVMSIVLGVCAVILLIVIIVTWQTA